LKYSKGIYVGIFRTGIWILYVGRR